MNPLNNFIKFQNAKSIRNRINALVDIVRTLKDVSLESEFK